MEVALAVVLLLFLGMAAFNYSTALRLHGVDVKNSETLPSVSVLIPARNEAHNLVHLIPSLLASEYKIFEILLLDDNSEDNTKDIALQLLEKSNIPYKIMSGKEWSPEAGISGKNWACHQLSQFSKSEVLIFCDADVTVSPQAIGRTLKLINENPAASGLSGLPRLKSNGYLEQLIFPWIMQIPLSLSLPLRYAWKWKFKSMQLANGQWLAIRKVAYEKVGGHQALGLTALEDVQLAKNLVGKSLGGLIPVIASRDISVLMYSSWSSMVAGFSKNLILIFGGTPFKFFALLATLNLIFFLPLVILLERSSPLITVIFILLLVLRSLASLTFGNSFLKSIFQFVLIWPSLIVLNYFSFLILRNHYKGQVSWKGRKVSTVVTARISV